MILFSQQPTPHTRIGNSLVWMAKFNSLIQSFGGQIFFPWAVEHYSDYLSKESRWLNSNPLVHSEFNELFGCSLTAASLYKQARLLEDRYERVHGLSAFKWRSINADFLDGQVLLISGVYNVFSDVNFNSFSNYRMIIFNEPFNCIYDESIKGIKYNWDGLQPTDLLISRESNFISSLSSSKTKVGLHIRRGDYAEWNGGKYFYDDAFWLNVIDQFNFDECAIWIFTNEKDSDFLSMLKARGCFISDGDANVDFVRLMCMDSIYGPPSTFSSLAVDISKQVFNRNISLKVLSQI
jgi:hypothetical protein